METRHSTLSYLDDALLCEGLESIKESIEFLKHRLYEHQRELQRRLEEDNALAREVGNYVISRKPKYIWDTSALRQLLELLPDSEIAKLYQPERMEKVAEKWNKGRLRHLGKYGSKVQNVLDAARHTDYTLEVKRAD